MFRNLLPPHGSYAKRHAEKARRLHQCKLQNAACIRVVVEFPAPTSPADGMPAPVIVDAECLFGTDLKLKKGMDPVRWVDDLPPMAYGGGGGVGEGELRAGDSDSDSDSDSESSSEGES